MKKKHWVHPWVSAHYQAIARKARPKVVGTEMARERARKAARERWRKYHEKREREANENAFIAQKPSDTAISSESGTLADERTLGMDEKTDSETVRERDIQEEERERLINELFFNS